MSYSKDAEQEYFVDKIKRLSNRAMETVDGKAPYRENQEECVEISSGI
jgi:hypothetical protein